MEISTQHADLADIMTCQTRVALEKILKREAQGVRLSYTLIIRGEPKVSDHPTSPKSSIGDLGLIYPAPRPLAQRGWMEVPQGSYSRDHDPPARESEC